MINAKRKISLNPISKTSINTDNSHCEVRPKRSISLKPLISCKTRLPIMPSIIPKLIKPGHKIRQQFLKPRQQSRPNFDQRILNNQSKNCRHSQITIKKKLGGLSQQALFLRKQSHLNTYFNNRKNRLKQITVANKKIYVKLNSQKSLYSSRQLDKSFESNCSLSRRLSQSKLSHTSSKNSLHSSRQRKETRKLIEPTKRKSIKIESKDINKIERTQVERYLNIFCNNVNKNKDLNSKKIDHQIASKQPEKQNKFIRPMNNLERIVEEYTNKPKGKHNFVFTHVL